MKKLLPILIGLSLTGFSALSQAEDLIQVYKQARLSNPELRKSAADRDAAFEKLMKHAAHYYHSWVWVPTIPTITVTGMLTASTLTSPAVRSS